MFTRRCYVLKSANTAETQYLTTTMTIGSEMLRCRKCGHTLQATEHEARKCPKCKAWTFNQEKIVKNQIEVAVHEMFCNLRGQGIVHGDGNTPTETLEVIRQEFSKQIRSIEQVPSS